MVKMFSYGSNMSLARLHVNDRAPSATIVGIAHIKWFILKFNKIGKSFSKGNSGKANIEETGNENDIVWGVIYEITGDEKDQLDIVEKGYHISNLVFTSATGVVSAYTYIANVDAIDNNLAPFDWYKKYVVDGAEENGLPEDYVDKIRAIEVKNNL